MFRSVEYIGTRTQGVSEPRQRPWAEELVPRFRVEAVMLIAHSGQYYKFPPSTSVRALWGKRSSILIASHWCCSR